MKTKIILFICMMISAVAFGQDQKGRMMDEVKVTPPKFTGTEQFAPVATPQKVESVSEYMAKNIQYPEKATEYRTQGASVIQFVVTPTGEITDLQIINSISPEIDKEAIRVLKTTNGMWSPGTNDGQAVAMETEVTINFKLDFSSEPGDAVTVDFTSMGEKYYKQGSKRFFVKGNAKQALRSYDNGVMYLPNDKSLLMVRGLCKYELGDKEGATQDWNRLRDLGGVEMDNQYLSEDYQYLKGYAELMSMLSE